MKRKYSDKCIPDLVKAYAPSHENETAVYEENLLSLTGIDPDKKISNLSADEFTRLVDAIEKLEGYHNGAGSRRETWVPVTTINATDGARPLADEEITIRLNGKETTLRSNAVGQFPPVPHAQEPTEVLQRTTDGTLKNVGTIEGEQGKTLSLVKQLQRFTGMSGPDKPPGDAHGQKQPFVYHVQPGDTLSSIARRFRTSVEQIRLDNSRRGDKLFAGEVLGIYGPLLQGDMPSKAPPRITPKLKPIDSTAKSSSTNTRDQTQETLATRSDAGEGKPLALIPNDQRRAPWMIYAIAEAKRLRGMEEAEIEASGTNYHTAIKDGIKTMVGDKNAWCAAFVNWCLLQAGYPIDTKGGWAARARGIYSHDERDENGNFVQNPLFTQIQKPIYGCIALVTGIKNNIGTHVGFVYGKENDKRLAILGGNQTNRVMFTSTAKNADGKKLLYFVPTAYQRQALTDIENQLKLIDCIDANKQFGISIKSSQPSTDR